MSVGENVLNAPLGSSKVKVQFVISQIEDYGSSDCCANKGYIIEIQLNRERVKTDWLRAKATLHKCAHFPPSILFLHFLQWQFSAAGWFVNMATAGASGDDLRKELTCAICLDFFKDPVILKCGHNFCRFCICMHWDENGGDYGYQCPQCRTVS